MKFNEDDRAQRLIDVFPALDGQINISYVNSTEHIVAWHKHEIQTDYWCCVKGSIKVGIAEPDEKNLSIYGPDSPNSYNVKWEFLSDKNPTKTLMIPPGSYHGYKALEQGSILLYYLTHKYNPNDELRAQVGFFGENWNTPDK